MHFLFFLSLWLQFPAFPTGEEDTVKFLNFWTPEKFAVINLKSKQRGQT